MLVAIAVSAVFSDSAYAQSITVDVEIFGLNENQTTTRSALAGSCEAIETGGALSSAARDLQSTCLLLEPLADEDPVLASGLDRIVPEEAFSASDALTEASDGQVANVRARVQSLRNPVSQSLFSSGKKAYLGLDSSEDDSLSNREWPVNLRSNLEFFVSGQIAGGDVDGTDIQQDAETSESSFTFGADYRFGRKLIVGAGMGFFQSQTEFKNVLGETTVEGINTTLFSSYYLTETLFVDAVLDRGVADLALERQINLPTSATVLALGDTKSTTYSMTLGVGAHYLFHRWEVSPRANLAITSTNVDAYTERPDADSAGFGSALGFSSRTVRSVQFSVGAHLSRSISLKKGVLAPYLSADVILESEANKGSIEARFLIDPNQRNFTIEGSERELSYLNVSTGGTLVLQGGKSAFLAYETRLLHDSISLNTLTAGLRLEF